MKRKSLVATTVTKRHHRDEIWLSWPAAAQGGDSSKPAGATPARTSGHSLSKPICLQHSDARGRRRTPRSLPRRLPAQELRHGSGRSHACVLDISAKWRRATHDRRRYGAMEPGTGVWRGLCQALTSARATDRTPLRESGVSWMELWEIPVVAPGQRTFPGTLLDLATTLPSRMDAEPIDFVVIIGASDRRCSCSPILRLTPPTWRRPAWHKKRPEPGIMSAGCC